MHMFEEHLKRLPPGTVQCEQDRKQAFRRLLLKLGGALPNRLAAEFKQLTRTAALGEHLTLYTLRSTDSLRL